MYTIYLINLLGWMCCFCLDGHNNQAQTQTQTAMSDLSPETLPGPLQQLKVAHIQICQ